MIKQMQKQIRKSGVLLAFLLLVSICMFTGRANAAGLLTPKDSGLPELDIKDHKVKVIIEDGYAITYVDQVFYNPHSNDLEAIYSFPVPEKGAVSEFTMWIDGKPIHGEVLEKKEARRVYEDQKSKGNNAGLTEKKEYKTFEVSVYPVRAGQDTRIKLCYLQPSHIDTNMGQYVYPLEEGGVDEEALAFWTTNEKVKGVFSFDLVLRPNYPVDSLRLPSHPEAKITQNNGEWHVHLDNLMDAPQANTSSDDSALTINNQTDELVTQDSVETDPHYRLDRDIVVYYRHASDLPGAVDLVAYKKEGAKRGTFMLTITPGMDLKPITEGRDWVFILDISGSMYGKYSTLAEGVSRSIKQMSDKDRFRIILFNQKAQELTGGYVPATAQNIERAISNVSNVKPSGSTNLYAGLDMGLKSLDSDRTSSLILVTDGVANVGVTKQKEFIKLIKKYDTRLFTFIMGNSANRPLLETMTRASHGFAMSVSNSDDIIGKLMIAQSKVTYEALHGAKLNISGVKVTDVTPAELGNVYRGEQLVLFGHYFGSGNAHIKLTGKVSGSDKVYETEFKFPDSDESNPEIERLWAYATIERLTQQMRDFGEESDIKQSVTDLGVEFSLVTDYTSMIVLEEKVFDELGIDRLNQRRISTENQARQIRSSRQHRSTRVDNHQPMFGGNRPSRGGAGALDPVSLLLVSPLLWGLKKRNSAK